jgi:chemotaxis protein methyltransferase CheR
VAVPVDDVEPIEVDLLLEAIYRRYHYDFRGYASASLRRRLWRRMTLERTTTLTGLQERILHDPDVMERLLGDLSINVTELFRDPGFHLALRRRVIPTLRTYPFVRIWIAGCSTGEELYSVAIALHEEGLLDRARIYATDINADVLARARAGSFPLERLAGYSRNYLEAGGSGELVSYYRVDGDRAVFDPALMGNVVFAQHNLAMDGPFNEFNLVLCRNVMIYFGRTLQDRVLGLFESSLAPLGILALGRKETLTGSEVEGRFEPVVPEERIYRRRR